MLCSFCPPPILGDFHRIPEKSPKSPADKMNRACEQKDQTLEKIRTLHSPSWKKVFPGLLARSVKKKWSKTSPNTDIASFFGSFETGGVCCVLTSGSFSAPNLQVCRFYFLNLAQKEKPLLRKPDPPYKGVKVPEIRGESSFCPEQVLLASSTNFHSRPGCRQKILSTEVWGWGWGWKSDPQCWQDISGVSREGGRTLLSAFLKAPS